MSDYRREPVEGAAPLTHTDAETLISARLDGPLDPVMNRALLAHLATCESCRAFASQMESMATAFRDLPVLPPSPTVARKVRAEIRSGGSPMRRFGRWMTTSKTAPATALAGAAIALALVTASVFGTFDDDNGHQPTVSAPNFAAQSGGTSSSAAQTLTVTPPGAAGETGAPTRPANVQVAPTQQPTSSGGTTADVAMKQTEQPAPGNQQSAGSGNEQQSSNQAGPDSTTSDTARNTSNSSGGAANTPPAGESDAQPAGTEAQGGGQPTPTAPSQAAFSAASEQSPEATATKEPAATATEEPAPTETAILSPTETATPEPTATATSEPTETATPEPTETATPEPIETATDTPEPTPTGTATPEPTAIIGMAGVSTPESESVSPTVTPQPAQEAPTATETPGIVPRDGSTAQEAPTTGSDQVTPAESEPTVSSNETTAAGANDTAAAGANETAAAGANESQSAQIVPRDGETSNQTETPTEPATNGEQPTGSAQGGDNGAVAPAPAEPLAFGDLPDGSFSIPTSGSLIPSGAGLFAVEHPGGGMEIYDGNGVAIVSGYGYNPVWGNGGQTLYTAGGAISEGSSAINGWSAAGGPEFVTEGNAIDTPAGDIGGLGFIRFQPGGDPVLSLWTVGADAPIWQSNDYQLVSQTIYVAGGTVFAPTDQGWLAIPAGGGDATIVGGLGFDGIDEVILSPDGSQVAFISGGTVYVSPSTNPSAAAHVADAGNGGVAWTPMGLAVASGSQVSIWTGGGMVTVVDGGGDLTAPVWTGNELIVADASQGGATKMITADQINTVLAG